MKKGKVIAIILLACVVVLAASLLVFRGDILKVAVQNNYIPVVRALISSGADVNETSGKEGTPLMVACREGHEEMVKLLLNEGADPNVALIQGNSVLMEASITGNLEIARILIEAGADIDAVDNRGYTALTLAHMFKNTEIEQLLIEKGADASYRYIIEKRRSEVFREERTCLPDKLLEAESPFTFSINDGGITGKLLPNNISSLVQKLGEPDNIDLPDPDDPSPWGQWFTWPVYDGRVLFRALGDDYSPFKTNCNADVRYITIAVLGQDLIVKTFFDLEFNRSTRRDVKRLFPDRIMESERHDLKVNDGGFFYYFNFRNGQLVGVAQCTFDMDFAD